MRICTERMHRSSPRPSSPRPSTCEWPPKEAVSWRGCQLARHALWGAAGDWTTRGTPEGAGDEGYSCSERVAPSLPARGAGGTCGAFSDTPMKIGAGRAHCDIAHLNSDKDHGHGVLRTPNIIARRARTPENGPRAACFPEPPQTKKLDDGRTNAELPWVRAEDQTKVPRTW